MRSTLDPGDLSLRVVGDSRPASCHLKKSRDQVDRNVQYFGTLVDS